MTDAGDDSTLYQPALNNAYSPRITCAFDTAWNGFPQAPVLAATAGPPALPRRCTTRSALRNTLATPPAAVEMSYGIWMPASSIEEAVEIESLIWQGVDSAGGSTATFDGRPLSDILQTSTNSQGILICM